jgi:hypothetical protein
MAVDCLAQHMLLSQEGLKMLLLIFLLFTEASLLITPDLSNVQAMRIPQLPYCDVDHKHTLMQSHAMTAVQEHGCDACVRMRILIL